MFSPACDAILVAYEFQKLIISEIIKEFNYYYQNGLSLLHNVVGIIVCDYTDLLPLVAYYNAFEYNNHCKFCYGDEVIMQIKK
jgi:hypothetical protein